jgi:hypothetical protein
MSATTRSHMYKITGREAVQYFAEQFVLNLFWNEGRFELTRSDSILMSLLISKTRSFDVFSTEPGVRYRLGSCLSKLTKTKHFNFRFHLHLSGKTIKSCSGGSLLFEISSPFTDQISFPSYADVQKSV